jgi:hypothetical protein
MKQRKKNRSLWIHGHLGIYNINKEIMTMDKIAYMEGYSEGIERMIMSSLSKLSAEPTGVEDHPVEGVVPAAPRKPGMIRKTLAGAGNLAGAAGLGTAGAVGGGLIGGLGGLAVGGLPGLVLGGGAGATALGGLGAMRGAHIGSDVLTPSEKTAAQMSPQQALTLISALSGATHGAIKPIEGRSRLTSALAEGAGSGIGSFAGDIVGGAIHDQISPIDITPSNLSAGEALGSVGGGAVGSALTRKLMTKPGKAEKTATEKKAYTLAELALLAGGGSGLIGAAHGALNPSEGQTPLRTAIAQGLGAAAGATAGSTVGALSPLPLLTLPATVAGGYYGGKAGRALGAPHKKDVEKTASEPSMGTQIKEDALAGLAGHAFGGTAAHSLLGPNRAKGSRINELAVRSGGKALGRLVGDLVAHKVTGPAIPKPGVPAVALPKNIEALNSAKNKILASLLKKTFQTVGEGGAHHLARQYEPAAPVTGTDKKASEKRACTCGGGAAEPRGDKKPQPENVGLVKGKMEVKKPANLEGGAPAAGKLAHEIIFKSLSKKAGLADRPYMKPVVEQGQKLGGQGVELAKRLMAGYDKLPSVAKHGIVGGTTGGLAGGIAGAVEPIEGRSRLASALMMGAGGGIGGAAGAAGGQLASQGLEEKKTTGTNLLPGAYNVAGAVGGIRAAQKLGAKKPAAKKEAPKKEEPKKEKK